MSWALARKYHCPCHGGGATECWRWKHLVAHQNHSRILSGWHRERERKKGARNEHHERGAQKKTVTDAHPRIRRTILTNGERPQTTLNIFVFACFFFCFLSSNCLSWHRIRSDWMDVIIRTGDHPSWIKVLPLTTTTTSTSGAILVNGWVIEASHDLIAFFSVFARRFAFCF